MRYGRSLLSVLLFTLPATAAERVKPFTLPDTAGKPVSPLASKDRKAFVIVFVGTECPINNAYMPRLIALHREFADQGVSIVAINSNRQDTAARMAEHAKKYELPFPVLKDERNLVADQFGAKRTPEAFLLDADGTVRYRGRIDDQFGIGYKRPAPTRNDLAEALDELLAGKAVSVAATEVSGCPIARVPEQAKPAAGSAITYTNRIASILDKHCVECHRTGEIGPMPLRTYDDVTPWALAIQEAVGEGRMPPWHADPKFGHFSNNRRLSDDDRQALLTWIEHDCPRGEGEAPRGREYVDGWTIGKPDAVFSMDREFYVPAQASRRGIAYQYFQVDPKFTEDRWITAAEARPGNRSVVHHIIVFAVPRDRQRQRSEDGIGTGFLVGWAPGDMPLQCTPGVARRIPKDSVLLFQMHYTPNGHAGNDRSSVGFIFAKEPPKWESKSRSIATKDFALPPGDDNHRVQSASRFRQDVELVSLTPHMHLRGKSFEYRAVFPDGKTETLLSVPRYDFNWQTTYRLEQPIRLPAGTRVECTAHFDNSTKNLTNPDPSKTVTWGDQTWEEMMIGFVDYTVKVKD